METEIFKLIKSSALSHNYQSRIISICLELKCVIRNMKN